MDSEASHAGMGDGIYGIRGMFGNYQTRAAVMCFQEANRSSCGDCDAATPCIAP